MLRKLWTRNEIKLLNRWNGKISSALSLASSDKPEIERNIFKLAISAVALVFYTEAQFSLLEVKLSTLIEVESK